MKTSGLHYLEKAIEEERVKNPLFDEQAEYHNKLMKEVFGDINPMELDRTDPKKAKELVDKHGVKTIEELKGRQDELLNDKQKLGLKYYEDILKRIPRAEIEEYDEKLNQVFNEVIEKTSNNSALVSFEILDLDGLTNLSSRADIVEMEQKLNVTTSIK